MFIIQNPVFWPLKLNSFMIRFYLQSLSSSAPDKIANMSCTKILSLSPLLIYAKLHAAHTLRLCLEKYQPKYLSLNSSTILKKNLHNTPGCSAITHSKPQLNMPTAPILMLSLLKYDFYQNMKYCLSFLHYFTKQNLTLSYRHKNV